MKGIKALQYFDQAEMEIYINEDSDKIEREKTLKEVKPNSFAVTILLFGLLVSSVGLFNYFSYNSYPEQSIYKNND